MTVDLTKALLFGVAVGDALGVPVEFSSRQERKQNPVTDMTGYGTYNLPPGTWSDDSSLTFCLAEALTLDFKRSAIAENFVKWYFQGYWTATGHIFDVGRTTEKAILRINSSLRIWDSPPKAYNILETDNGNGSLMRIAPLVFYLYDKSIDERFEITRQVSSLTHGHIRSVIACFYYLEYAKQLLKGKNKFAIYTDLQTEITSYLTSRSIPQSEIRLFARLLKENIHETKEEEDIQSTGYVLHTLEASIWCLLTTENYREAVLKAVNLGEDTDTTAAVTGALAGLCYGLDNIPQEWISQIARGPDIADLAERLSSAYSVKP
ncbi:MAG: ADP-ribosylglycohydrolase family protein [Tannerella sp.]|jgi:ADP-ribosylglycohydrolase|nr:ADP-ribosylglycohydrolase family protein [Tannerella sp.]